MPRTPLAAKQKKVKAVPYRFIVPDSDEGRPLYDRLHELLHADHRDVAAARFALAWQLAWKPDVDGHVTLGQCRKVTDLDREITDLYDFIIILNKNWWDDPHVTNEQRNALLDHECCHAAVKCDASGAPVIDERGRIVYRLKKHDVEDFACIAERHGVWKRDLEQFARALARAQQRSTEWVGATALQADLRKAGISLPLTVIAEWSNAEWREARTWALLQHDGPARVTTTMPAVIAQAVGHDPTGNPQLPLSDRG